MATDPHLIVNGKEYPIPDNFTLGELADIEKITGQGYDLSKGGILGTMAMIYVALHRTDTTITIEDIRSLEPDDFEFKGEEVTAPLSVPEPDSEPNENTPNGNNDGSAGLGHFPDPLQNDTGDPTSVTNATSASGISPA